jgi:hypothetical protein
MRIHIEGGELGAGAILVHRLLASVDYTAKEEGALVAAASRLWRPRTAVLGTTAVLPQREIAFT